MYLYWFHIKLLYNFHEKCGVTVKEKLVTKSKKFLKLFFSPPNIMNYFLQKSWHFTTLTLPCHKNDLIFKTEIKNMIISVFMPLIWISFWMYFELINILFFFKHSLICQKIGLTNKGINFTPCKHNIILFVLF